MLKEQFTFPQSLIATHTAPVPFEDPISHQLPPEPISGKSSASKSYLQSFSMSGENSKGNYVDFTLGNSPQYSNTFQPQILFHPVSKFNKNGGSPSTKYVQKQNHPEKQQNLIKISKTGGNTRDLSSSKNTDQLLFPQNDRSLGESKTERQSKQNGSRVIGNSSVREGGNYIHNQVTTRNPREDSIYLGDNVKKKFMNKAYPLPCSRQSPDKSVLINRIQELKSKLAEAEGINKTLGMQLQGTRQKFKIKDAENHSLKEKIDDLIKMYEDAKAKAGKCGLLEGENTELKKMNQFFCEQIDKHKMQIIQHQEKNEQSLRLLQKLNENITKREQKLQKQLSQQIISFNKLTTQKLELEQKLRKVSQQNTQLQSSLISQQSKNKQLTKDVDRYLLEIQELKNQKKQLNSESKMLKNENGFLKTSLAEQNAIKSQLLMDLGKRKEQNSRLKQEIQQLSDEKSALISENDLKLAQMTASYQQKCSDLKKRIDQCQNKIEALYYENKQYQMKLEILNQANDENLIEIKDLKQEKKTLYIEKQELKSDVKHLIEKNDKQLSIIEMGKQKQIDLNNIILERQNEIIGLEERITENIGEIANKDITIKQLQSNLEHQRHIKEQNNKNIEEKSVKISELQEKLRKYEQLLAIYKQEITKIKENKESQWQQMKVIYEEQIVMLEEKLKEFISINEKRAIRNHTKINKEQKQNETFSPLHLITQEKPETAFEQICIPSSIVQCFSKK